MGASRKQSHWADGSEAPIRFLASVSDEGDVLGLHTYSLVLLLKSLSNYVEKRDVIYWWPCQKLQQNVAFLQS